MKRSRDGGGRQRINIGEVYDEFFGAGFFSSPDGGDGGGFVFAAIPFTGLAVGVGGSASPDEIGVFGFVGFEGSLHGPTRTGGVAEEVGIAGLTFPRDSAEATQGYVGWIGAVGVTAEVGRVGLSYVTGYEKITSAPLSDIGKKVTDSLEAALGKATDNILSTPKSVISPMADPSQTDAPEIRQH
jgi:hypothetical protein